MHKSTRAAAEKGEAVNFNQLEYLVSVMREGSYADAARALYVTPQAVSKAIGDLERELGRPLFQKRGRRVEPTPFAIDFSRRAEEVVRQFAELKEYAGLHAQEGDPCGAVTLALPAVDARGQLLATEDFASFHALHPSILVKPQFHQSEICLSAFVEGFVDAAVVFGSYSDAGVRCTKLLDFSPSLMVHAGHPLAGRSSVALADLDGLLMARPLDMRHVYATLVKRIGRLAAQPIFADVEGSAAGHVAFLRNGGAFLASRYAFADIEDAVPLPFAPESGLVLSVYYLCRPNENPAAACLGEFLRGLCRGREACL